MRATFITCAVLLLLIDLSMPGRAQTRQRLNPVIGLLEHSQPVFGVYWPANGGGRRGGDPPPARPPLDLAKDALAYRATDFLYGDEFLDYQKKGKLHRLDLAFSRDQAHKVYVQNRMLENAKELWGWLQSGAYFYVCGDAKRMAKDVDAALHKIVQEHGGKSVDEANAYVEKLKTEKRYKRDVY